MAIRSLARVLPQWERWAKRARPFFEDTEYPLPLATPKFLGYTSNDFGTKGKSENHELGHNVSNLLIPSLEKQGMLLESYQEACQKYAPRSKLIPIPTVYPKYLTSKRFEMTQ